MKGFIVYGYNVCTQITDIKEAVPINMTFSDHTGLLQTEVLANSCIQLKLKFYRGKKFQDLSDQTHTFT